MGFTPLDGRVMVTRSGALDPGNTARSCVSAQRTARAPPVRALVVVMTAREDLEIARLTRSALA